MDTAFLTQPALNRQTSAAQVPAARPGRRALAAVLDRLAGALLIADPDGRVLYANPAAEALAAGGDVMAVMAGERRLGGRVRAAVAAALIEGEHCCQCRDAPDRVLAVLAWRLDEPGGDPRFALVSLSDPGAAPAASSARLCALYGLTRTEAALTARLVGGDTLAGAALGLGMALGTARNHLKRIFAKTGARGQAELLRIVLAGPLYLAPSAASLPRPRTGRGARRSRS
jgi:DNA-binding CsgD family transcriptional regulator